uniref:Uncharacterized protein n=1 Tax=Heliothis virescens TaxID=7102 RepID=A0A2A4JIG9_HELVI
MLTRRAASFEEKLRATLKELESSKTLCKQLLQERDDSEVEVKLIVDKNTELKNQLAELHVEHMDTLDQHQHLSQLVSNFQECSDTHELALRRISELELELSRAHNTITQLESAKSSERAANTCSLYNELVGSVSGSFSSQPIVTIDLTNDTLIQNKVKYSTHNKIKKYLKINRVVKKLKKTLKKYTVCKSNNKLRRKNINLANDLNNCEHELDMCRSLYDSDIQRLQEQLCIKENSIRDIFHKYEASQLDLNKRMQEACELVDLVINNAEKYELLTDNISCNCSCLPISEAQRVTPTQVAPCLSPLPEPPFVTLTTLVAQLHDHSDKLTSVNKSIIYIFSDKFGQGIGSIFNQCSHHHVINHCVPGSSFSYLTECIRSSKLIPGSTVILIYGDSLGVTKKDIFEYINLIVHLNEVNKIKFILCALPYSDSLTREQNSHIFNLNMLSYNSTCRLVNAVLYFDINEFTYDFKLTEYSMYLPARCRRHIANILAYNIHTDTGTHNVSTDIVSTTTNIPIDMPSSLNY